VFCQINITCLYNFYGFGFNSVGQVGSTECKEVRDPTPFQISLDSVIRWYPGGAHTFMLTKSGHLYANGWNHYGQTGIIKPKAVDHCLTDLIPFVEPNIPEREASNFSLGNHHSLVITTTGAVYAMGSNSAGQLGVPKQECVSTASTGPTRVQFFDDKPAKSCDSGQYDSLVLCRSGKVYHFGNDNHRVVGLTRPKVINVLNGGEGPQPIEIPDPDDVITNVRCGYEHSILLTKKGRIYTFGTNTKGELGLGHFSKQEVPQVIPFFLKKEVGFVCCGSTVAFCGWDRGSHHMFDPDTRKVIYTMLLVNTRLKLLPLEVLMYLFRFIVD